MKKKEFAVGEVFQLGLMKIKVVEWESYSDCDDCVLSEICDDVSSKYLIDLVGGCGKQIRADKKNVTFVRVEEIQ